MLPELLRELNKKNIQLTYSKGKLQYSGPKENITEGLLAKIKENKEILIKHFWPLEHSNLMPIRVVGNKIPLVIVHGEKANYFLKEALSEERPIYGYLHVGSEGEKIKYNSVQEYARAYVKDLLEIIPEGPIALAGYSFGGIVAFEMACILQKQGRDIPFLGLIDCVPPNTKVSGNQIDPRTEKHDPILTTIISKIRFNAFRLFFVGRRMLWYFLLTLHYNFSPEIRQKIIMDKYIKLFKKYTASFKYKGEILLFIGNENEKILREHKRWTEHCDSLKITELNGNHETIMNNKDSIEVMQKTFKDRLNSVMN